MSSVTVVVVSYNTRELTLACLGSVIETGEADQVIVLDNASVDGSAAAIGAAFPTVELWTSDQNVGFARGVNLAAKHARGDFILLLNPDARLEQGDIATFVDVATANPDHGLYGCMIRDGDGHVDPTVARPLPGLWSMACYATALSTIGRGRRGLDPDAMAGWDRSTPRTVGMLSGAALLIDRRVWARLGGFDGRYFVYAEDADLCLRAARLGHRPYYSPKPQITHLEGASSTSTGQQLLLLRGKATYFRQHWGAPRRPVALALLATGVLTRRALARTSRRSDVDWGAVWRARRDWLRGYDDAFWNERPEPTVQRWAP